MARYSARHNLPFPLLTVGLLVAASQFTLACCDSWRVPALRLGQDLPIEACRRDGSWRSSHTSQQLASLLVTPVLRVLKNRQISLAVITSNTGRPLSRTYLEQISVWASVRWVSEDTLQSLQDCMHIASFAGGECTANVTRAGGVCNVAPRIQSPPQRAAKVELNVTIGYLREPCRHSIAELDAGCQTGVCQLHCRVRRLGMNLMTEPSLYLVSMHATSGGHRITARLNGLYGRYISLRNATGRRRHLALVQIDGKPPVMECQSEHCCRMTAALSRRRESNTITLFCVGSPHGIYASRITATNTAGTTSAFLLLHRGLLLTHTNFYETHRWSRDYKRHFTVHP